MAKSPIDEFLVLSNLMIENGSSDPELKAEFLVFGYTDEKWMILKTLYNDAFDLHAAPKKGIR